MTKMGGAGVIDMPHREAPVAQKSRPDHFLLSVVIPCFNEEEVISATYRRLVSVLTRDEFRLELVFVDDGSTDQTATIVGRLAAADRRIRLVRLSRNFGHQAAVNAGLSHAGGDAAAVMDADLQDPPEILLEMIERWQRGFDVVYGVRRKRKEAAWKRVGYSLFYRLQRSVAAIDAPLDAGDFSLIDRQVLDLINRLPEKNRFFRGLRSWVGFAQTGVPYERAPRAAGTAKYPLLKLMKLGADGIFSFSTVPLTIVFCLGLTISILSFAALALVFYWRVSGVRILGVTAGDVQGYASTIIVILFIGGVQLVCTGIVGEYVGRIYQEVKARPNFIAREDTQAPASTMHDKRAADAVETEAAERRES